MIKDRNVIVFDDFTTTGMSLEWARQLLDNAGAKKIILMTVGKYPKGGNYSHRVYKLPTKEFSPYELQNLTDNLLIHQERRFDVNNNAPGLIQASFEYLKIGRELPPVYWNR